MEATEEAAELFGQWHERADDIGDVAGRHVDCVGDEVAGQ